MKKTAKGSALIELCLALAISAIVFMMVATVSSLVHFRTQESQAQVDSMQEINQVSNILKNWMYRFDRNVYDAEISRDGKSISVLNKYDHSTVYAVLEFEQSAKRLTMVDENRERTPAGPDFVMVDDLSFDAICDGTTGAFGKTALKCTVTYHVEREIDTETVTLVFVSNSWNGLFEEGAQ